MFAPGQHADGHRVARTQLMRLVPDYRSEFFEKMLGKGDLLANYSRSVFKKTGRKEVTHAVWQENVGHFQINHWFNLRPHPSFGSPFDGSTTIYEIVANDFDLASQKRVMESWIWGEPGNGDHP